MPTTSIRHLVPAATQWADQLGYSRAVRVGQHVWVAGTVSVDPSGAVVGTGDAYVQAKHILHIIGSALDQAGAQLHDVVRTRMYLRDWSAKDGAVRAHREAFAEVLPVATVIFAGLVDDALLVEIEVEAYVP